MKVLHIVGRKKHGKTTLLEELIRELTARGLRVGTLKHCGHEHELDTPGTDSFRHGKSGAASVSEDLGADLLLVDGAVAGAGVTWDWQDRSAVPDGRWILAGGLTPDNVARAVATSGAWGVDVSSGIESGRGIKSPELMTAFAHAVRGA